MRFWKKRSSSPSAPVPVVKYHMDFLTSFDGASLENNPQNAEVPLAFGSVHGFRWWELKMDADGLGLVGAYSYWWKPGENLAKCGIHAAQEVPANFCMCGFYAYWGVDSPYQRGLLVSGIIEGYGSTIVGTAGFRCQKARIVALAAPSDDSYNLNLVHVRKCINLATARVAAHKYGVPFYSSIEDMMKAHPTNNEFGNELKSPSKVKFSLRWIAAAIASWLAGPVWCASRMSSDEHKGIYITAMIIFTITMLISTHMISYKRRR